MATLEKIRNKSVLLVVVIFAALLAFILGDALTNGRSLFGDQTTVVDVDGEKIDITQYQNKISEISGMAESRGQKIDEQALSQQAIDALIFERLFDQSLEELGIEASNEQIAYYTLENPINQNLVQLVAQMQQNGLLMLPKNVEDNVKKLVEAGDEQSIQKANQEYSEALIGLIPNAYEVLFNPQNSGFTEDQVAPYKSMWIAFEGETADMIKQMTYQALLANCYKANKLDARAMFDDENNSLNVIMAFKPFGTLDENKYTVSDEELKAEYEKDKKLYKVVEPMKSLEFIAVSVAPSDEDKKAAQELAKQTVSELGENAKLSKKLVGAGVELKKEKFAEADIKNPAVKNFVKSAPIDSVAVVGHTNLGFTVVRMGAKEMKDSVEVYNYDVASYSLIPSEKTVSEAKSKLQKFVTTNNTAAKFTENAVKEGYANITPIKVTASTPAIMQGYMGYYPATKALVRWAVMDAEKGQVSEIYDNGDSNAPMFYVAAVVDEYDEYVPYTDKQVKEQLEMAVRTSKAGDELVKQYSGKGSIESTAEAMGVEPQVVEQFRMASREVRDPKVIGKMVGTQPGKVVVVKAADGVYAYEVKAQNAVTSEFYEDAYKSKYLQKFQPNLNLLLRDGKKIENKIFNFVSE